MTKKITIQHYYTTGSTAPTSLELGEIAIAHSGGSEAIYIKNGVKFIPEEQIIKMFDEAGIQTSGVTDNLSNQLNSHKITEANANILGHVKLVNGDLSSYTSDKLDGLAASPHHFHSQYLTGVTADSGLALASLVEGSGEVKIGLSTDTTNQINSGVSGYTKIVTHEAKTGSTQNFGHVKLVGGDLSGKTGNIVDGEAAASHHTHSQYLTEVVGSNGIVTTGLGVNGIMAVKIDDETRNKINSGVTAFGWGDHASQGYAKNSDLTSHTNNDDIHVSKEEKDSWTNTASSAETWNKTTRQFNAFMSGATTGGTDVIDTLIEIQDFLSGDDGGVKALLDSLSALTTDVENNTSAITKNTNNITAISGDVKTISGRVDTLSTNVENIFENFVQTVTGTGSNIKVEEKGITEKSYEISHTPASTQASAITVTNSNEVISFGSTFDIVNKIAYDANGHVVSGSTQTLTLPNLLTATTDNYGVVKLKSGELTLVDELINEDSSKTAAGVAHGHTEYVKYADLTNYKGSEPLVISCGTY